jgi:hypothetical protein
MDAPALANLFKILWCRRVFHTLQLAVNALCQIRCFVRAEQAAVAQAVSLSYACSRRKNFTLYVLEHAGYYSFPSGFVFNEFQENMNYAASFSV